ncbi:MAG: ATP-binding protein [Lachnospiraceae bacterium]|nr:ATP-binding protein [Lachnospiraceae bacterium]
MGLYYSPGKEAFRQIRKAEYVDKSGMISFVNSRINVPKKFICFTRARRFGKSYAVKMLCAYYDYSCDSGELFQDLKIAGDGSYKTHLNQYHVIYIDITWFISQLLSQGKSIDQIVLLMQSQVIEELASDYPQVKGGTDLPTALFQIAESTGRQFVFLIDEWDAIFREAADNSLVKEQYLNLLRGLFKSPVTSRAIAVAYMTGILPIKKYGKQSALTDVLELTMVNPGNLACYVGFTEDEVKTLCKEHELNYEDMKRWYDGYSFDDSGSVYNPNSVMEAISMRNYDTYWANTETYESLKSYIEEDFDGIQSALKSMLSGQDVPVNIRKFQNDMSILKNRDDVFTLLIHLGYLAYDRNTKTVRIPNEEIRQEFITAIEDSEKHVELARLIVRSRQLLKDTLAMREDAVAEAIESVHQSSAAPLFYNNEQALRSVVRTAYMVCIDEYAEIQELPTGHGYADLVYLPRAGSPLPVLLIELKWNESDDSAIAQIKDRKYPKQLENLRHDILLVGINYSENDPNKKHTCKIEKQTIQNR